MIEYKTLFIVLYIRIVQILTNAYTIVQTFNSTMLNMEWIVLMNIMNMSLRRFQAFRRKNKKQCLNFDLNPAYNDKIEHNKLIKKMGTLECKFHIHLYYSVLIYSSSVIIFFYI